MACHALIREVTLIALISGSRLIPVFFFFFFFFLYAGSRRTDGIDGSAMDLLRQRTDTSMTEPPYLYSVSVPLYPYSPNPITE